MAIMQKSREGFVSLAYDKSRFWNERVRAVMNNIFYY